MINRFYFKDLVEDHGEMISVSNDGTFFVLKKSTLQIKKNLEENHRCSLKEKREVDNSFWKFSIMSLSIYGIKFLKNVNLLDFIHPGKQQEVVGTWFESMLADEKILNDS